MNDTIENPVLPQGFVIKLKIGIYKELYKKNLITKEQLDALIALQKQTQVSNELQK